MLLSTPVTSLALASPFPWFWNYVTLPLSFHYFLLSWISPGVIAFTLLMRAQLESEFALGV